MLVTHTEPESMKLKSIPFIVLLDNMSPTPQRVVVLLNLCIGYYIYILLNVVSLDLAKQLRCLRLWIQWLKWFMQPSSLIHRKCDEQVILLQVSNCLTMDDCPSAPVVSPLFFLVEKWTLKVFLDAGWPSAKLCQLEVMGKHWWRKGLHFLDPALPEANFFSIYLSSTGTCSV